MDERNSLNRFDMNDLNRLQLENSLTPILISLWNANNEEKVGEALVRLVYVPKEFDGSNPPKVRFTLLMRNGRCQDSLNCDKVFVDLFDDIVLHLYKRTIGI